MNKRAIIITGIIVGFLALCAVVALLIIPKDKLNKNNTLTIAYYNVNQSIQTSLTDLIQKYEQQNEKRLIVYEISDKTSLSEQIKKNKIDLIFASAGYAVNKTVALSDEATNIPSELLSQMFSTMYEAAIRKGQSIKAIPLIFDNLEIDIEKSEFYMSGLEAISTWEEIERFLQIQKSKHQNDGIFPMSFAGSDPVLLLDIIGAFGEAFEGLDSYNKAVEILTQAAAAGTSFDAKETANKLFIDAYAPLAYSFSYLKQFVKQGYVTPSYKVLRNTDINSFLQQRVTNLIITNLSTHRTFDVKAISRYSSIFVPSKKRPEQRHFTANITYAVPVSSNKNDLKNSLLEYLVSTSVQSELSNRTGLAPVLANCSTPDLQADDARYWIAATSTPLAGLGHEAELSEDQLQALKNAVIELMNSI